MSSGAKSWKAGVLVMLAASMPLSGDSGNAGGDLLDAPMLAQFDAAEQQFFRSDSVTDALALLDEQLLEVREGSSLKEIYATARAQLLAGFMYMSASNFREAERWLTRALRAAETLDDSQISEISPALLSESYRIQADAWLYLARGKGLFFQMTHGQKFRDLPLQALDADPGNRHARLSRAVFLINAPAFAGGDPEAAETILAGLVDDTNEVFRFKALAWFGQAQAAQGRAEEARQSYYLALNIIPGSTWIETLLRQL